MVFLTLVEERAARRIRLPTPPRRWTAREIALLGELNDYETQDQLALLGVAPDAEIARRFGRSLNSVSSQRWRLHIAAPGAPRPSSRSGRATEGPPQARKGNPWTPAQDRLLGTADDKQVGARLGRTQAAVWERRKVLGIPPATQHHTWLPSEDALIGVQSDAEIARRLGFAVSAVKARRQKLRIRKVDRLHPEWPPEHDQLLGKSTDGELARRLGRTAQSVRFRRKKLGIPGFTPQAAAWTESEDALVGTMPDSELAARLGRTRMAVEIRRQHRGIPPWLPIRGFVPQGATTFC